MIAFAAAIMQQFLDPRPAAAKLIRDLAAPDTFFGRETQAPFSSGITLWLNIGASTDFGMMPGWRDD